MEQKNTSHDDLKDIPDSVWVKLSKKTFYFGHQSVGWNILQGIEDINNEYPKIKLRIVQGVDANLLIPGTILHSNVGYNTDPKSKFDDFFRNIDGGIGKTADVVSLKLCYVDIMADSKPEAIFAEYQKMIEKIRQTHPGLTIIHFTTPLTTLQTGPKAWVKKILGIPAYGVRENINRHAYNELLRSEYQGKDPILDIAEIESTYQDGTRCTFKEDGKVYYSLVPNYTTDGGHLNRLGRIKVAERLLIFLTNC